MILFNIFFIAFCSYLYATSDDTLGKVINGLGLVLNFIAVVLHVVTH